MTERAGHGPTIHSGGRTAQKERTKALLLGAAREMLAERRTLTIPALAEQTGVSRATIYRYFPSNDQLIVDAASPAGDDPLGDARWPYSPGDAPTDTARRAEALVATMADWAFDHETQLRALLRVSLDPDGDHRVSRVGRTSRHRWIAALLAELPADVSASSRERLAAALHGLFGSDAIVWTTDMAGLDRGDAARVLGWMARVLTQATIDEGTRETD